MRAKRVISAKLLLSPLLVVTMRYRLLCLPIVVIFAVSCADGTPITNLVDPDDVAFAIADAERGYKAGFYWQPPMVRQPSYAGDFDSALSPEVVICELAGDNCAAHLVTFTTASLGSEMVRLEADDEHYSVNWHLDRFSLSAGEHYRISVFAGEGVLLGYADVVPVSSGRELKNVDTGEFVGLIDGRTLPIKFRIETGIVARVEVDPVDATIFKGETQQYTATVFDLSGDAIAATVSWSSSDQDVATVDADGLATGTGGGTATLIASSDHENASASITVMVPIARIDVEPSEVSLAPGETQLFVATLFDENDEEITGRPVAWVSSDMDVATVDSDGLATAVAAGDADITATAEQISGSAQLGVVAPPKPFVTTWDTSLGAGTSVTLALGGTVDATIDWGDGTIEAVAAPGPHVHDYGTDGVYTVSVTGTVTAYNSVSNGGAFSERAKLVTVGAWGAVGFTSMRFAFHSASNLLSVPATSEGLESTTDMSFMFAGASSFNQPIGGWETGSVIRMDAMFWNAEAFNQPIGDWDTGSVTHMNAMFVNTSSFNQPIGDWDTGSVTQMQQMFQNASAFNQPLGGWHTGNVLHMGQMFWNAEAFNQALSAWCVSLIASPPSFFDTGATSWAEPRPVWGTCPTE